MYAKVLKKVDFNEVIETYHKQIQTLKAQEKMSRKDLLLGVKPDFEYVKPTDQLKTEAEWAEISDYAEFITDFFVVNTKSHSQQAHVDLEHFMVAPPSDGKSIFQRALAARNEYIAEHNEEHAFNRNLFIKDAISDFNAL